MSAGISGLASVSLSDTGQFVAAGSTLTMDAVKHAGKTILLDTAAGSVVTLPASTGAKLVYRFMVSVLATSNSHKIQVANSSDILAGTVLTAGDGPSAHAWVTASDSDTITLNRTTTGSVVRGEWFEIVDIAANVFLVRGVTAATGTEATPFSAAV